MTIERLDAVDRRASSAPAFVALVRELVPELRPSTRAAGAAAQLPAARVTFIGDRTPLADWTTAVAQVDVWAASEDEADRLAFALDGAWRSLVRGDVGDAFFSGAWVEQSPRALPDPDADGARYFMELGLVLHALETR